MSAAVSSPASPSPATNPAKPTRHRKSSTLASVLSRAKVIAAALLPLLAGIAKEDAEAASPAIDAAWVARLNAAIAAGEQALGGRTTALVGQMAATAGAEKTATALVGLLKQVRQKVEIHNPDDEDAQRAFGRGVNLSAKDPKVVAATAQAFLAAYADAWTTQATNAGVTQATMDQVQSLAATLSRGGVAKQSAKTSRSQETLAQAAAAAALTSMCAFAVKVVTATFGKGSPELATVSPQISLEGRAAKRKAAAKAKKMAAAVRVAAKKAASRAKPGARAKSLARKARRAAVGTLKSAIVAGGAKKSGGKGKGKSRKARSKKAK